MARLGSGTERTAEYVDIIERMGMAGYGRTRGPSHPAAPSGSGRRPHRIITLSWWPDIDDIRAFTGEHFELAQCYPEDDEYLEPRSPHYEVALRSPAFLEALDLGLIGPREELNCD